jgi:hypothetical protein
LQSRHYFYRPLPSIEVSDLLQVSTQRSFPLRLQPEFALALMVPTADSFAHRKASATVGGGDDPVSQCHFFTFSPSSTRRRMSAKRDLSIFAIAITSSKFAAFAYTISLRHLCLLA